MAAGNRRQAGAARREAAARRDGETSGSTRRPGLDWLAATSVRERQHRMRLLTAVLGSYGDMSDPVGRCSFECIGSYLQTVLPSLIHRSYLVKHRVYWSDLNSWMIGGVWRPAEVLWWLMKSGANDAYTRVMLPKRARREMTDETD